MTDKSRWTEWDSRAKDAQPEISVADMVEACEYAASRRDLDGLPDDALRLRAAAARLREMQAGEWVRKPVCCCPKAEHVGVIWICPEHGACTYD